MLEIEQKDTREAVRPRLAAWNRAEFTATKRGRNSKRYATDPIPQRRSANRAETGRAAAIPNRSKREPPIRLTIASWNSGRNCSLAEIRCRRDCRASGTVRVPKRSTTPKWGLPRASSLWNCWRDPSRGRLKRAPRGMATPTPMQASRGLTAYSRRARPRGSVSVIQGRRAGYSGVPRNHGRAVAAFSAGRTTGRMRKAPTPISRHRDQTKSAQCPAAIYSCRG